MPASPTWNTKRVFITYRQQFPPYAMEPGTWVASESARVTNTLSDGSKQVFRAGKVGNGALNTVEGAPSLVLDLPVVDDPDNMPQGGEVVLTITFASGGAEVFHLSPLLSWPGLPGTDLALILDPTIVAAAPPYLVKGVPGGVAALNSSGDVVDAAGNVVGSAGVLNAVQLTGDQTVGGQKTFSVAPVVPDDSFTSAVISDLDSATRQTIGAALAPGTGVAIVASPDGSTYTISAAGGGTGGGSGGIRNGGGPSDLGPIT